MLIQYSCMYHNIFMIWNNETVSEFCFVQTAEVGRALLSVCHFQLLALHIGYFLYWLSWLKITVKLRVLLITKWFWIMTKKPKSRIKA